MITVHTGERLEPETALPDPGRPRQDDRGGTLVGHDASGLVLEQFHLAIAPHERPYGVNRPL